MDKQKKHAIVSKHSVQRGKQRRGLNPGGFNTNVQRALNFGLQYNKTSGELYHALRSRLGRGACAVVYYANAIYVFGARNVLITVLDKNLNYDKELYKYVKYPVFIQYKQDRYRYVKDKTKMKAEIAAGTSYYIDRVKEILSGTGAEVVSLKVHSDINGYLVHIKSDPIPYDLIQKIQQEIGVNVHYVGDEIVETNKQTKLHELKYKVWSWFGYRGISVKIPNSGISDTAIAVKVKKFEDKIQIVDKYKQEFEKTFGLNLSVICKEELANEQTGS